MSVDSGFNDFRLKRLLLDGINQKQIKSYKHNEVLSSLIRMVIMESTQLISDPVKTAEIVQYDIRTQQHLSLNSLFCFNSVHIVTKSSFTFPAKSMFIFAHNAPLSKTLLESHPLVNHIKGVRT